MFPDNDERCFLITIGASSTALNAPANGACPRRAAAEGTRASPRDAYVMTLVLSRAAAQRLLRAVAPYDVVGRFGAMSSSSWSSARPRVANCRTWSAGCALSWRLRCPPTPRAPRSMPASALLTFTKTISGRPRRSGAMPTRRCMKPSAQAAGGDVRGDKRYLIRSAEMKRFVGAAANSFLAALRP